MAQTKSKSKSKSKAKKPQSSAKAPSSSRPKAVTQAKAATQAVGDTAKDAGRTVGHAASKAKVPLVAGGAALAGAAGGLALGVHQAHRRRGRGGIDSDDLAKAARKVGDFGAQVGEFALELRRAREQSNGKAHRSPIEVVLEGLTARGSR